jgi:Ras-related C3 botulinum toxin substrate 1
MSQEIEQNIKLCVVGDGTVGKTCMLVSYANDKFPVDYVPTIFENYVVDVTVGKKKIALGLWDTAGQEDFDRLRPLSYPGTGVFLICFSVVNPTSFKNVETKWAKEIKHYNPTTPIILVGTKSDLREDEDILNQLRNKEMKPVEESDAQSLAKRMGAVKYMECSALRRDGLKDVFDQAIISVLFPPKKSKKKKTCSIL